MEIQKDCETCKYENVNVNESPCNICFATDKWYISDKQSLLLELTEELNTKLYSEAELKHMSKRDVINGEAVNKVVGELIDWVNGKL